MILLSGATGKVGTALVAQLQAQRIPFRALAHTGASFDRLREQQIDTVLLPEPYGADLAAAFDDVDRFFLLTPGGPEQAAIERGLVDAASQAGVERIVKLSVLGAGDSDGAFFQQHRQSERYIQQSGLGYTLLRPNAFMQNIGTADAALIVQQNTIVNSTGDGSVSFIDTRDIAAVALAALRDDRHRGQIYTLTGPAAYTYGALAQQLTALLGRSIRYVALDDAAYRDALMSAGLPAEFAGGLAEVYRFYRAGNGALVTDTVERITGRPARTLQAYLAEHRSLFVG